MMTLGAPRRLTDNDAVSSRKDGGYPQIQPQNIIGPFPFVCQICLYNYHTMEQIQPAQTGPGPWQSLRDEFGGEQAPISSPETAAELVSKWAWIDHEQEFRQYEEQLKSIKDAPSLEALILQTVVQDKEESWKIPQNFSLAHLQGIIAKARVLIVGTINAPGTASRQASEADPQQPQPQAATQSNLYDAQDGQASPPLKNEFLESGQIQLPSIKARARVYEAREMNRSFHLLQQTQEEYQVRSPSMFEGMRSEAIRSSASLFRNKWLRKCFYAFTKQNYAEKSTFDSVVAEGERMNMNKWMVFCKEFDFHAMFPQKELIGAYQTAARFKSTMDLEQFLTAVALIREKYLSKYNSGDDFVRDVLNIDGEGALRVKLENRKIKYSNYTKNFFAQANYPEPLRLDEARREKEFQAKRKERETVLVKGMLSEHIRDEIGRRKAEREHKRQLQNSRVNKSHTFSLGRQEEQREMERHPSQPRYTKHTKKEGYARVFAEKRNTSQVVERGADRNYNTTNTGSSKLMSTDFPNNSSSVGRSRLRQAHEKMAGSKLMNPQRTAPAIVVSKEKQDPARREWPKPPQKQKEEEDRTWLTRIRSDSEESDDILREHLESEKKAVVGRESVKLEELMREMEGKRKKVEQYRRDIVRQQQREEEQDRDMVATQAHFTAPLK